MKSVPIFLTTYKCQIRKLSYSRNNNDKKYVYLHIMLDDKCMSVG